MLCQLLSFGFLLFYQPFQVLLDLPIAKLDRLDAETRLLGKQHISTIGELTAHRETATAEIDALTAQRQELRKELRRVNRQGISLLTSAISTAARLNRSKMRLILLASSARTIMSVSPS